MDAVRSYEEVIKDNIKYAYLVQDNNIELVKSKFMKIRKSVYSILRQEQRERQPNRAQDMER